MFKNCCCRSKNKDKIADKNAKEVVKKTSVEDTDINVARQPSVVIRKDVDIEIPLKDINRIDSVDCEQKEEHETCNNASAEPVQLDDTVRNGEKNDIEGENVALDNVPEPVESSSQNNDENVQIQNTEPDNDSDDEVFTDEVIEVPARTEKTMKTPHPAKRSSSSAPKLTVGISLDEDDDLATPDKGGGNPEDEVVTTPVGKDEVALRRHRFFSEVLTCSRAQEQYHVHFNPLGPVVVANPTADATDQSKVLVPTELESLIVRLETITDRLEKTTVLITKLSPALFNTETNKPEPVIEMSVDAFKDIIHGPLSSYSTLSGQIGGEVANHARLVQEAFQAQLQYLTIAAQSKAPEQSQQISLLQPTSQKISAIQELREKNRTSTYFNHLSAISESIPALGWVTVSPAPAPYVKEMNDAGQFYTNRVLKEWKEKDKKHVEWVKAWVQTLTELQQFVKQHHTTGLIWAGKGTAPPPPPPGGMPPPPPMLPLEDLSLDDPSNDERAALFAQINQGEDITKSLKKVTADMQTHKNPTLRTGPAPFKTPTSAGTTSVKPPVAVDKPPVFSRDGKKWLIEYQKGNRNLLIDNAEMNNVVYMFKCTDSTLSVKGKLNSVVLDSCKKTSIVFDSLVASVEFINCQSVQMQVLGKVPTISIDKTDGCQMYLSKASMDVEIISSKSSEMNVMIPKSDGDYTEYPIPEQYKTTVSEKGLQTTIIENKG